MGKKQGDKEDWIMALFGLLLIGTPMFWVMSTFESPWWSYILVALTIMGGMMSKK